MNIFIRNCFRISHENFKTLQILSKYCVTSLLQITMGFIILYYIIGIITRNDT